MAVRVTFDSIHELASYSAEKSAIVLVVGQPDDCQPLFDELKALVLASETVVNVDETSRLFKEMEPPALIPAVGLWSSKGCLAGYRESRETLAEFLADARRFT